MKKFEDWKFEEIEITFGLRQVKTTPLFDKWLHTKIKANAEQSRTLAALRDNLAERVDMWNEDELKLFFIGPLLMQVNFETPYFRPFTQRALKATIGKIMLHGKVDFMLAQGRQEPRQPFFCLQEYKQENRRDNDPRGQLLAAMVAAQANNVPDLPIYGAYVSGRNWFFVLLEGTEYTVSPAYDAAQEDVFQVFAILSECKNEIVALSKKLLPTGK